MNDRTELLNAASKPILSVVVYKAERSNTKDEYYLESHQINEEGKILEGKPLLQETISDVVDFFYSDRKERAQISGYIPENVIYYKPEPGSGFTLAWYKPSEKRYMHFAKQLKINSGMAWVPPCLYIVSGNELNVYCMKADTRPTEKTQFFRAPFHNINDEGFVCLGNANVKKPKSKSFVNIIKYWEDLFWLSEFAHTNGDNPTKTDLTDLWRKIIKSNLRIKWKLLSNELVKMKSSPLKKLFV